MPSSGSSGRGEGYAARAPWPRWVFVSRYSGVAPQSGSSAARSWGLALRTSFRFCSAPQRVPGVPPGGALAAVASTGYLGFLTGPPLIGVVAEAAGLATGLGLVSAACAIIALKASALPVAA